MLLSRAAAMILGLYLAGGAFSFLCILHPRLFTVFLTLMQAEDDQIVWVRRLVSTCALVFGAGAVMAFSHAVRA